MHLSMVFPAPSPSKNPLVNVMATSVGSFVETPGREPARVQLFAPKSGMRFMTSLVLAYTFAVMALALFLPGAKLALLTASDGAAAILLAVPAVVVALLARPGENAIASQLLMPYRVTVSACSLVLIGVGGSIVGVLHEPYMQVLWVSSLIATGVTCLYLTAGLIVGEE